MDDLTRGLADRLRSAETFAAVAGAVIEQLTRLPGVVAVAVEAHDQAGPVAWFASPGFAPPPGHFDRGRRDGPGAAPPVVVRPQLERDGRGWVCPLVGCGERVGALRVRIGAGAAVAELLAAAAWLVSVRIAQLRGAGGDVLGAGALTARQYEISVLVARGSTNAEIARLLSISPDAVKKHVSRALVALEVSNRTELAAVAGRWRWESPAGTPPPGLLVELRARPRPAPRARAA
ncbi:MAG TPA: LuxR C-terminal-related transcriptional regulator [Kofleriaceae bacterium]|nr:LuxR C-terminal-related transcriptional regulator [Kofleriaceae bacterium]